MNAAPIKAPTKGEKISEEELDKIWDEIEKKYNEMEHNGVDTSD